MYVKGCETVPQSGRTNQLALPAPGVILACRSLPLSCFSTPHPRLHCSDVCQQWSLCIGWTLSHIKLQHRLSFSICLLATSILTLRSLGGLTWTQAGRPCSSCQEGAYCGREEPVTLLTLGKPVVSGLVVERLIWHL